MRRGILIIVMLFALFGFVWAQVDHFQPVEPTGRPFSIIVQSALVNDSPLMVGDEIGIFDADLCVGADLIEAGDLPIAENHPLAIISWQGDPGNQQPGFTPGNIIMYRIWSDAGGFEVEAEGEVVANPFGADGTFGTGPFCPVRLTATTASGDIEGTVISCITNEPIENVTVVLNDEIENPVLTNALGQFGFYGVALGPNVLHFTHPNFYPGERTVVVNSGQVVNVNMVMTYPDADVTTPQGNELTVLGATRTGSLNLRITNTGCAQLEWRGTVNVPGQPNQTWLALAPAQDLLPANENRTIVLNANLNNDPGFEPEHGMELPANVVFSSPVMWDDPPTIQVIIHFILTGPIVGTVRECDENGPGIPNVSVYLNDDMVTPAATTDQNGHYSADAPAGMNNLHFRHPQYHNADLYDVPAPAGNGDAIMTYPDAYANFPQGRELTVIGATQRGSMPLQLVHAGCHDLVWNATVVVPDYPGQAWLSLNITQGTLAIGNTANLTLNANLTGDPGFTPEDGMRIPAQIQFGSNVLWTDPPLEAVEVVLAYNGEITGIVTECNDGGPIEGVSVFVGGNLQPDAITDALGRYTLNLVYGQAYNLRFTHSTHYEVTRQNLTVPTTNDVEMSFPGVETESDLQLIVDGLTYTGSLIFEITNNGCASLNWSTLSIIPAQATWFRLNPSPGTLAGGEMTEITASTTDLRQSFPPFRPGHDPVIPVVITFNNAPSDPYLEVHPSLNMSVVLDIDNSIQGMVRECTAEGPPIEGVGIHVENSEQPLAVTDELGYYSVDGLPIGYIYDLSYRHPGHFPVARDNIYLNQVEPLQMPDIVMTFAAAEASTDSLFVVVEIINFFSDSVGYASFELESTGCLPLQWQSTVVDPQQRSWLRLSPSSGTLNIGQTLPITLTADLRTPPVGLVLTHELMIPAQVAFTAQYWDNAPTIDVYVFCVDSTQYPHYGNASGQIYLARSSPHIGIPNATVTIGAAEPAVTDANGYYSIQHIITGNNRPVTVSANGYFTLNTTVRIREGNNPNLDFPLEPSQGVDQQPIIITEYKLWQNYPNPFNPITQIQFDLVEDQFVKVSIYDLMGREVYNLVNSKVSAGRHAVEFEATDLPTGIYFYNIETEVFSDMKKMLLIK